MSSSVMQLVEREMKILELPHKVEQIMSETQSTADFFTRNDREKVLLIGFQLEQVLRDLGELKHSWKQDLANAIQATEAHEKRIRALEDDRLKLRTEVATAAATSKLWITVISGLVGGAASLLIKLFWH